MYYFKGDGDFRSLESRELLEQADIVVTNPPFSLFREFVAQMMEYNKKFIIIGHQTAVTSKNIFPFIRDNKIWLEYGFKGAATHFINKHYEDYTTSTNKIDGMIRVSGVVWYTNLKTNKQYKDLPLYKTYKGNECDYPKYDNYNAIEVSKTKDIPLDYDGVMGVPISFMNKYNPEQFEIIGCTESHGRPLNWDKNIKMSPIIDGVRSFKRLLIRNKKYPNKTKKNN